MLRKVWSRRRQTCRGPSERLRRPTSIRAELDRAAFLKERKRERVRRQGHDPAVNTTSREKQTQALSSLYADAVPTKHGSCGASFHDDIVRQIRRPTLRLAECPCRLV